MAASVKTNATIIGGCQDKKKQEKTPLERVRDRVRAKVTGVFSDFFYTYNHFHNILRLLMFY